jgi:2'-5' RNA ligase
MDAMRTRESAIGVNLHALAPALDRWRLASVDAARHGVPPHITLLYPWRSAPLRPIDLAEAATALAGVPPFMVTLRDLGRFPGVLCLRPEPQDVLRDLIRRLAAAFPDTPPYGGEFADPLPHLTVAKANDGDALDRIEAEVRAAICALLPLTQLVEAIAIEEEGEDGMWSQRAAIPLGGLAL